MEDIGTMGEKIARFFLEERGYVFIEANFRTRHGEIDLIMKDSQGLVFIEVKTRHQGNKATSNIELPEHKLKSLQAAIDEYLEDKDIGYWRTELAAVTILSSGLANIKLIDF